MHSDAATVEDYISSLEPERAAGISQLVKVVRENLQPGFVEDMRWGMISYEIPMSVSGPTYNNQPLSYVGIASQKRHFSIYLMGIYADPKTSEAFARRWAASGRKLDVGKGCVRFTSIEKADLETIGWAVRQFSVEDFLKLTKQAKG